MCILASYCFGKYNEYILSLKRIIWPLIDVFLNFMLLMFAICFKFKLILYHTLVLQHNFKYAPHPPEI